MDAEIELSSLTNFERKFALSALFVCLPIIFAKIFLWDSDFLETASEIAGGKENLWFLLLLPFNLAWEQRWLLVCLVAGIMFTCVSYYIVYLDSSVPGVQPPSPFSAGKQSRFIDDPGTTRGSHMFTDNNTDNNGIEDTGADNRIAASLVTTSAWVERFSQPAVDTSANATKVRYGAPHNTCFQNAEQQSLANNEASLILRKDKSSLEEDRFDVFGKLITIKLRNLPKHQMLISERIINDVLFEAEKDNLTLSHRLAGEEMPQKSEQQFGNSSSQQ